MIVGKKVRLRAIERNDLPLFIRWFNDPEVIAGLSLYLPLSFDDEEAWYEGMRNSPQETHPLMIDAHQGDEWAPIGDISLMSFDWRARSAEIGIAIGEKAYWDQGCGTEAMRLMAQHGFETLNLNRIFLRVYATNSRAIRSYEKVGFVHEGRMRQAMYKHGQYIDILLMSVLRSEWYK